MSKTSNGYDAGTGAVLRQTRDQARTVTIEQDHRRHALQIAGRLPDGRDDALAVLECMRELVTTFLWADTAEPAKATIVTLVRDCQDLSA